MYSNKKILYKRLNKETENIIKKYNNFRLDEMPNSTTIKMTIEHRGDIIEILFPDQFPFRKPQIHLNGKIYHDMLYLNTSYFKNYLNNMGIKCLCCQSIMCTRNWIPCRRIIEILDEVTNNKKLVREMIYTYYLEKICAQNNIHCMELFDNIVKYF
jgi:ubiquitin-protein ligase